MSVREILMTGQKSWLVLYLAVVFWNAGLLSAWALDADIQDSGRRTLDFFRTGIAAYKSGHTEEAVRALHSAADMGHMGARWKLARIYAKGDGVPENDLKAYNFFLKIVYEGAVPGSRNEAYVSDALMALGNYTRTGIAGTAVTSDPVLARDFYIQAASSFGNPDAQFELGKMLLSGEGGDKNPVQAARWFQLSAKKGNVAAQAMLGSMLFQAGKTVRGLAMMTAAFERAKAADHEWIRIMQEKAFAISAEPDRRTAVSLAGSILASWQLSNR